MNDPTATPRTPDGGATILVVDDDEALRRAMAKALGRAGHRVLQAGNGFEARQALDGEEGRIDLVVMDLVLPGIEGREAANLLKAHQPDVKVLYVSGYSSLESVRSGAMRKGEPFLRKPFEIDELVSEVESLLDAPAGS